MAKRYWKDIEPSNAKAYAERDIFHKDRWLYFSGWDCCARHIINQPAVYVIYLDGEIKYVGQSNTPRFRFGQHRFCNHNLFETPWGTFVDMYAKIKFPSKYGQEAMIEKRLIKRLKPVFNKYTYKRKISYAL